jgi:hypothetical protein
MGMAQPTPWLPPVSPTIIPQGIAYSTINWLSQKLHKSFLLALDTLPCYLWIEFKVWRGSGVSRDLPLPSTLTQHIPEK